MQHPNLVKEFLICIVLSLLGVAVLAVAVCKAGPAEEFEFELLLQKTKQQHSIVHTRTAQGLKVYDYRRLSQNRWQGQNCLVFVSSPGCAPCERFKQQVLASPRVIMQLNNYCFTMAPKTAWQKWKGTSQFYPPFIAVVRNGRTAQRFSVGNMTPSTFLQQLQTIAPNRMGGPKCICVGGVMVPDCPVCFPSKVSHTRSNCHCSPECACGCQQGGACQCGILNMGQVQFSPVRNAPVQYQSGPSYYQGHQFTQSYNPPSFRSYGGSGGGCATCR